jgi:hypothetical protein
MNSNSCAEDTCAGGLHGTVLGLQSMLDTQPLHGYYHLPIGGWCRLTPEVGGQAARYPRLPSLRLAGLLARFT